MRDNKAGGTPARWPGWVCCATLNSPEHKVLVNLLTFLPALLTVSYIGPLSDYPSIKNVALAVRGVQRQLEV